MASSSFLSHLLPPPRHSTSASPYRTKSLQNVSNHSSVPDESDSEDEGMNNIQSVEENHSPKLPPPTAAAAPSYEERCRAAAHVALMTREERQKRGRSAKLFVPRTLQDFDDGGAFPEIHVAQYPRHLGNPHLHKNRKNSNRTPDTAGSSAASSTAAAASGSAAATAHNRAIVNVEIDREGNVSYDAIVKGGTNRDKIVYTKHEDLKGGAPDPDDIALPTPEEEQAEANRTALALQGLLQKKVNADKPSGTALANIAASRNNNNNLQSQTQFIAYTPNENAPGYNPAAAQRVVQMVSAQVDPMMPPKHKHVKAPRGPADDPVPILHAPPTKLSKEEKAAWNIPACISNWKNSRGFTIPLDKRLAADGRGLRDHSISNNFASLSESLYVAERQARQEVRLRAQVQKKLALQEKATREEELRQLAQQARMERGGVGVSVSGNNNNNNNNNNIAAMNSSSAAGASAPTNAPSSSSRGALSALQDDVSSDEESASGKVSTHSRFNAEVGGGNSEDAVAAQQRDRLRIERKRERERELRMDKNLELKKKRLEEERDVSERIALGVHVGTGGGGDIDSRLYSQTGGLDSGFGAEDDYNTYSKPLFDRQGVTSASIYRPTRGETEYNADDLYEKLREGATSKFLPDKGFAGAEGNAGMRSGPRTAPVQFEKRSEK